MNALQAVIPRAAQREVVRCEHGIAVGRTGRSKSRTVRPEWRSEPAARDCALRCAGMTH